MQTCQGAPSSTWLHLDPPLILFLLYPQKMEPSTHILVPELVQAPANLPPAQPPNGVPCSLLTSHPRQKPGSSQPSGHSTIHHNLQIKPELEATWGTSKHPPWLLAACVPVPAGSLVLPQGRKAQMPGGGSSYGSWATCESRRRSRLHGGSRESGAWKWRWTPLRAYRVGVGDYAPCGNNSLSRWRSHRRGLECRGVGWRIGGWSHHYRLGGRLGSLLLYGGWNPSSWQLRIWSVDGLVREYWKKWDVYIVVRREGMIVTIVEI